MSRIIRKVVMGLAMALSCKISYAKSSNLRGDRLARHCSIDNFNII
jgi:hypothetical protein